MSVDKIDITAAVKKIEAILEKEGSIVSAELRAMVELLLVIIHLLMGKLGLNSSNSSKPPSTDPNRSKHKKAPGEKKKPGGQPGHKGSTLEQVENPDATETFDIDRRTLPPGDYRPQGYEKRQLFDITISRHVTEYRAEILQNELGHTYVAAFPKWITHPAQYAAGFKAQAVYMSQQQLIPYERVQDYFTDQCGIPVSLGSLFNFNKEAYKLLNDFELVAKRKLIASSVLHADETGINVNGKRLWLHTASSSLWTLFFPHAKRGLEAMTEMAILAHFKGILCHDHWKPYFRFKCLHALCNAHHLRELERAWEQDGQNWAKAMQLLLIEIQKSVDAAGGCLAEKEAKKFVVRYRTLLDEGDEECPCPAKKAKPKQGRQKKSKARNLLERLRNFETETLRFMTAKEVPFTNNQGERDIRMTKVQQKISGCFRAMEGAKIFCRVRSYLSTCQKHGVAPTEALRLLFDNKLPEFVYQT